MSTNIFMLDYQHLFLYFLSYAFMGWICEQIWCAVLHHQFTKRGMLYGTICPIYGFGALGILYMVYPWRNTWIPLFFASVIVTSALEYFTSWLLEKLFHTKWWDYTGNFLNINGRICFVNSMAFGIGGLALEHVLHPFVTRIIFNQTIAPYVPYISLGLTVLFTADVLFTVKKLVDFSTTLEKFRTYGDHLRERFENEEWFRPQSIHTMLSSIKEHAKIEREKFSPKFLENMEDYTKHQKIVEYWMKKFPSMTSRKYKSTIEGMKLSVRFYWDEQKEILKTRKTELRKKKNELKAKFRKQS